MRKLLWAPWRMAFIEGAHKGLKGCIFCALPKKGVNQKNLILYKGNGAYIIMNRYPYSMGHLMVVPNRHTHLFEELTPEEHLELSRLVAICIKAVKKIFMAQGVNVGLNLGAAAGAGIKDHLHYHIIPRWIGDHNLMPVIGDTKVMPEYLEKTYKRLEGYFKKL